MEEKNFLAPGPIPLRPSNGNFSVKIFKWRHLTGNDWRGIGLQESFSRNGGIKFVRDNDRHRRIRFEALQSEARKKLLRRSGRAPDDISIVVLVEQDRSFIKSEAVVKIMEYIDSPFPQLACFLQFVPLFIRDFLYDNVANNRYKIFGRSDACEI